MNERRLPLIDILRGVAVVDMVIFHFLFDLFYIYGFYPLWIESDIVMCWQKIGCILFIFISGFCFSFSRNPFKRGAVVLSFGIMITVVTTLISDQISILFGILTFLGSCMLIFALLDRFIKSLHPAVSIGVSLFLFLCTEHIYEGYIGVGMIQFFTLPISQSRNLILSYLGFSITDLVSADYFPIFPWIFIFSCGYFSYHWLKKYNRFNILSKGKCKSLAWIGRHSLLIYLLHQPILLAIFTLIL